MINCYQGKEASHTGKRWEGNGELMKRILAWISIIITLTAFVLLCLVLKTGINILIPICMFVVALILLAIVKRMPNDAAGGRKAIANDTAFYDNTEK